MRIRTTMRALAATGMAAVLGLAGAGAVQAAPTTEQLVRAVSTMLTRADIPDNIGSARRVTPSQRPRESTPSRGCARRTTRFG